MKKILATLITAFLFVGCTTIDETERGVVLEFGKYSETFDPGLHFYNIITKNVVFIPVKTQLETVEIESGSKDLQNVTVTTNVNYHVDPLNVGQLYTKYGTSYVQTGLQPKIKETITGITPQYVPEEMLQKREEIRSRMEKALKEKLDSAKANIIIDGFTITSFQFSRAFNEAIEAKQVQEQEALKEKNILEKIKYQNEQRVAQAKADSAAIAVQMQALKQQSGKEYLTLKWIEKWNGQLPSVVGNDKMLPMVNLSK
jgi:regulator of protease activity HflC (stomatin/prohibitin superfamily)